MDLWVLHGGRREPTAGIRAGIYSHADRHRTNKQTKINNIKNIEMLLDFSSPRKDQNQRDGSFRHI